ncbi:MAG: hypothetical protein FJX67_12815 [Alphaproteobacteria bacterium]|nr:hypothetical protein [Alphaproteobacteria bacterium]
MIGAAEVVRGLYGAWRLARQDAAGFSVFANTKEAALRSFWAAAVALPAYVVTLLANVAVARAQAGTFKIVLVEATAYVIGWTAFPLLILHLANAIGKLDRVYRYLAAYNWSVVIQLAALATLSIVLSLGVFPRQLAAMLMLGVYLAILAYQWYVAREGLTVSGGVAAAIVAIDFFLSLLIHFLGLPMIR